LDCASGCTQPMIGNKRCDEVCNVAECQWDGLDCGCAPACNYEEIAVCKLECLVLECGYGDFPGYLPCNDPVKRLTQRYYDIRTLAQFAVFPAQRYNSAQTCKSPYDWEFSFYYCVWNNYNVECLYSLGMCSYPTDTCERVDIYGCVQCVPGLVNNIGQCLPECTTGFISHPLVPDMCVPAPDLTTAASPLTLYVDPEYAGGDSDGSLEKPYLTLANTVGLWAHSYVKILLIGPLHYLDSEISLPQRYDRTNLQACNITISPYECEDVIFCPRPTVLVSNSLLLLTMNVIGCREWNKLWLLSISSIDFEENPSNTAIFHEFLRLGSGALSLTNVTFSNFVNTEFLVTFMYDNRIQLRNVHFQDMRGVVFGQLNDWCWERLWNPALKWINFTYENGLIAYSQETPGRHIFLQNKYMDSVLIANVTFTGLHCATECIFVDANIWMYVEIRNCSFTDNVLAGHFLRAKPDYWVIPSISFPELTVRKVNYNISSCVFRNNSFTQGGHFAFTYKDLGQDILLSNLHFHSEAAVLMSFASIAPATKQRITGPVTFHPVTNLRVSFPPAIVTLQAIEIVDCSSPLPALIYLYQLPYVLMSVRITGGQCTPAILAEQGYSCTIEDSVIREFNCEQGKLGLVLLNYTGPITLRNSEFSHISSSSEEGSAITIVASHSISMESLVVAQNENQGCGAVYISGLAKAWLSLTGSSLEMNKASEGGALCLNDLAEAFIHASEFRFNKATGAGAILLTANSKTRTNMTITGCSFEGNQAEAQGGALYVHFYSSALYLHLAMEDSWFEGNKAYLGAVLYLSSRIQLQASSHFSNLTLTRNSAFQAAIALTYQNGTLTMSSLRFDSNTGDLESCIYVLFGYSHGGHQTTISIENSVFVGNAGRYTVNFPYSVTGVRFLLSNVTLESNSGTALSLANTQLECSHSTIIHNLGVAVRLTLGSSAVLGRVKLDGNQAEDSAALQLLDQSALYCDGCEFVENTRAVQVESSSAVTIINSVFQRNWASDGSALKFLLASPSVLHNCSFTGNYAAVEGTVTLMSTSLALTNCFFSRNTAKKNAGLVSIGSDLRLVDCVLENQSGNTGYFMFITSLSTVNLTHTQLSQGESQSSAIYVEESNLTLSFCQITNLLGRKGAFVYAYGNANVTFLYTQITASTAINSALVHLWLSSGYFHYTNFSAYHGSAVIAQQSTLISSHCSFREGQSESGAGLRCVQCVALNVLHSDFEGLEALRGGAMEVVGGVEGKLTGCNFAGNRATEGGAVYAQDVNLHIVNSRFTNNSALRFSPVPAYTSGLAESARGRGGAVAFARKDMSTLSISHSDFIGNWAEVKGGAIAWEGKDLFPSLFNLAHSGNIAPYGPNISSFPTAILASLSYSPQSASGQLYPSPLIFSLIDHYGQTVTSDSSTKAGLSIKGSNATVYGNTEVTAHQGNLLFNNFSISATPGTNVTLTTEVPGLTSLSQLTVALRLCEPGESQVEEKCHVCKAPKYSLNPQEPCRDCPIEAVCLDGANVYPKAGYWRYDWLSSTFLQCPNPAVCQSHLNGTVCANRTCSSEQLIQSRTGTCLEGYTGNMCQTCTIDYHRVSKIWCQRCSSYSTSVAISIAYVFAVTFFCVFIVLTSIKSAGKPKSLFSVYLKSLMNYLQLVMLMGSFNLSWPTLMKEMLNVQDSAGSFSEHLLTTDCLVNDFDENQAFYAKLIMLSSAPVVFFAISSMCWLLVAAIKRSVAVVKNELVASGVMLFFLMHPSVMRVMFNAFKCEEVRPGEYWVAGLLVKCWEGKHLTYALAVALPAIIIWGLGVPGVILGSLIVCRKKLQDKSVKIRYGFLVKGYSASHFYWEFVIIYRKLLIISIATFLSRITKMAHALLVLSVLILFLILQHQYRPHSHPSLNTMEQRSLLVSIATIFFGLYFLDNSLSVGWEYFFFSATLGVNVYFLQFWLRRTSAVAFVMAVKRFAWLNQHFVVVNEESAFPYSMFVKKFTCRAGAAPKQLPKLAQALYLQKLSRQ